MRRNALLLRGNQRVWTVAAACCVLLGIIGTASCGTSGPPIIIGGTAAPAGGPVAPGGGFTAPSGGTKPLIRALVSSDGRHVTVPVSSTSMGCWNLALTADEQGPRVTLDASAAPVQMACASDALTTKNLTATLQTPLWGRALADGSTGQSVTYFDGRTLYAVGYIPAGYRLYQNTPWLDPWAVDQPTSPKGYNAWVREYVPSGSCPMDTVNVQVSQMRPASETGKLGTGPVELKTQVSGHPAELRASSGDNRKREVLTWTANGYGFAVAWSAISSAPCPSPKPLPASELLKIARDLHRLPRNLSLAMARFKPGYPVAQRDPAPRTNHSC